MEASDGTRGSGNSLELEDKNSDHTMEGNLENYDEEVQLPVAIIDDTTEVNQPDTQADIY